ncbi:MAG: hypothetical protein CL678_16275 [Bdellovibrionaceae bacterium]|nr:hypothetical protein [Pseudobdellovibrionaceae bacterium]
MIIFLHLTLFVGCSNKDTTPPELKNLGVSFGDTFSGGVLGDFDFTNTTGACAGTLSNCDCASNERIFFEFGYLEGSKYLPTFEYRVLENTNVLTPIDGIIDAVDFQGSTSDYAIRIKPNEDSTWGVEMDHVLSPLVSKNDSVRAGDIIGKPGTWSSLLNQGRVELMLYNGSTAYCPFDYFAPSIKDYYKNSVTQFMSLWESASCKNDQNIYPQGAMHHPGCLCRTMSTSGEGGCIE